MYILIGGDDEIAFRLTEMLQRGHEVALICPEHVRGPRVDRFDARVLHGAITSTEVLRRAEVERADLFIACSDSDENNLLACVSARHLGARRTACFLLKLDLQAPSEDRRTVAESLGIDHLVVPAEKLASQIIRIVLIPGALDVEVFAGGRVHLLRYPLEEGSALTWGPLAQVGVPDGVVLVMARRGETMFIPKGATQFRPGDKVTAMGTLEGIKALFERYLRGKRARETVERATVVGGGSVGLAVALGLERAGWSVKVIEANKDRCEDIAPLLKKGLVLHGDGTDLDLLESELIGADPVLVAVTSNDEKNLLVSLLAKHLGVPRILTRVDQEVNERLFERVGVDVVLSGRGAAVEAVLQTIGHGKADLLAEVEHGEAEVIKLDVPAGTPPKPLSALKADVFAIVAAILRGGRVVVPRGGDSVQGGDRLLIFCSPEHEERIREMFGPEPRTARS